MPTQLEKANLLRTLHVPGDPLLLLNVWDVTSARVVARRPDTRALATASWSISAALGFDDGGDLPVADALSAIQRIVQSTDLPVSADFEKGYATSLATLRANIGRLIATGAAGLNLEDSTGSDAGELWSVEEAAARVATVRSEANSHGVPLVINARTDILAGGGSVDEAITRGNAYLDAGADCVFLLGGIGPDLGLMVREIRGPVSVLAGANAPPVHQLASLGVARISVGPGTAGVAYAALHRMVQGVVNGADWPDDVAFRPGVHVQPPE